MDLETFETSMDGGEGGGAPAAPAEPAAPAAEPTPPAEAGAEPAVADQTDDSFPEPVDPEPTIEDLAWEVAAMLRQNGGFDAPQQAQPGFGQFPQQQFGPPPLPELDPYDPESVVNYITAQNQQHRAEIQAMLDGRLSPITEQLQAAQEAQTLEVGNQRAEDMIVDDIARNGDFATVQREDGTTYQPGRELTRNLAEQFMPAAEERYGMNHRAAEAAIAAAAKVVRDVERAAAAAERTRVTNHNATLAGAGNEPSPSGMATGIQGQPAGVPDAGALARKWASQPA